MPSTAELANKLTVFSAAEGTFIKLRKEDSLTALCTVAIMTAGFSQLFSCRTESFPNLDFKIDRNSLKTENFIRIKTKVYTRGRIGSIHSLQF